MGLIEVFHVVATNIPIDANNTTDIPQGRFVTLDANGNVILATGAATATSLTVGIAGDSRSTGTNSFTPESGDYNQVSGTVDTGALVIGAYGDQTRATQNKVADNYNEVLASGKMTVYHGGGEFWTDQYSASDGFTPGSAVYTSAVGLFTDNLSTEARILAVALTSPTGYPSGVPGTGPNAVGFSALPEGGNSLQWGTFLHVQLHI